ncbi:MAG TPA: matrixin family metalloprotease [Thermoanaerobaculia bacterium]|nr:matrixin family metalloprotease [Thermoanaerobaculia bacterium]
MKSVLRPFTLALLALPLAFSARPAAATTYMMMSDSALADQASAVVDAEVVGVEAAPVVDGPPATDYLVEVNRVLKGNLPGSTVVVRVPGGINPAGLGLKIWGAPQFADGERTLLFLRPSQDGTYRIVHLMLGAFHQRVVKGRKVALRDLSEASEVGEKGLLEDGGVDAVRDFDRFSEWVGSRAQGLPSAGSYVLGRAKAAQLGSVADSFTLLLPADGNGIRWFSFDRGQNVEWRVNSDGQPGLSLDATIDAFKVAMDTWNSDGGSNVQYVYSGTTRAGGGLAESDGVNTILFDDPYRDDPENAVPDTFDCNEGGVIAFGGPFFFQSTRTFRGKRFHEAVEADIVTNDGTECFFRDKPKTAEEVFAHELGHTLGLGHSKLRDALMFANAHDDGRGARLTDDDRAGIASIYGTGGGNSGGTSRLVAPVRVAGKAKSRTEVTLTWRDKATGEESYVIEAKRKGTGFLEVLSVDANSTSALVEDLLPGTAYTFRIRAAGGGGFSPYSALVKVTTPR